MKQKNKGGRPTKLTSAWLEIAQQVLNDNINAIILTDDELREEINDRITQDIGDEEEAKKSTISDTTFENWKRGDLKDPMGAKFLGLYKKALRVQKDGLFQKLENEPVQWQKYAWIIERKFSDWNLRRINEHTGAGGKDLLENPFDKLPLDKKLKIKAIMDSTKSE